MIHDYKVSGQIRRQNPRHRGFRHWLAVAVSVLIALGVTIRFVDLAEGRPDVPPPVSNALPLPSPGLGQASQEAVPEPTTPEPAATSPVAPAAPKVTQVAMAESFAITPKTPVTPAIVAAPADAVTDDAVSTDLADNPAETTEAPAHWVEHVVKKGDNLASIFKELGLSATLLHRITHSSKTAASLASIRPGQHLRVRLDDQGEFAELVLQRDRLTSLRIQTQDEDGFSAEEERKDVDHRVASASGVIESSLFIDGQKAGLSDGQIMELAAIFGWDIDFALELRAGDQFSLVYEDLYLDGERLRSGNILAAEFVNRGTVYRAVRFESPDGTVGYYDPDGHNKRRAFIRTPVKFARISSGFTTHRWHPVLKKWRSHKGVDYAAPTGTPVKATGAGRVSFKGWKGGYGRVVMIEHAGKYMTVYGHLSRFAGKIAAGTRVKQGQVIGYVGQSGLATGPHLHYEFRVAGVHRNPLTVKLPKSLPLPDAQMAAFRRATTPLLARLDDINRTMVANAEQSAN